MLNSTFNHTFTFKWFNSLITPENISNQLQSTKSGFKSPSRRCHDTSRFVFSPNQNIAVRPENWLRTDPRKNIFVDSFRYLGTADLIR